MWGYLDIDMVIIFPHQELALLFAAAIITTINDNTSIHQKHKRADSNGRLAWHRGGYVALCLDEPTHLGAQF